MAYGPEPAAGRRKSREHGSTLGRKRPRPLGLSTGPGGCQSEDELDDDVEDEELDEGELEEELEDEESLDELDVEVLEEDAVSDDDEVERLSVR